MSTTVGWPTHRHRARRARGNKRGAARRRARARRLNVKRPFWGYLT